MLNQPQPIQEVPATPDFQSPDNFMPSSLNDVLVIVALLVAIARVLNSGMSLIKAMDHLLLILTKIKQRNRKK